MIYGSVLFGVLLAVPILLILRLVKYPNTEKEQRDYRVVHFALRMALTLAIGAVIIGVILSASQIGIIPSY